MDGYVIERKIGSGVWQEFISIDDSEVFTWDDEGPFEDGQTYTYRIKRVVGDEESDWSNEVVVAYDFKGGVVYISNGGLVVVQGIKFTSGEVLVVGDGIFDLTGRKEAFGAAVVSTGTKVVAEGTSAEQDEGTAIVSGGGLTDAFGTKQVRAPPTVSGRGQVGATGEAESRVHATVSAAGAVSVQGSKWSFGDVLISDGVGVTLLGKKNSSRVVLVVGGGRAKVKGEAYPPNYFALLTTQQIGSVIRLSWGVK